MPASIEHGHSPTAEHPVCNRNEDQSQNQNVPNKKIFDTSLLVWRPAHDDHKRGKQMMSSLQLYRKSTLLQPYP